MLVQQIEMKKTFGALNVSSSFRYNLIINMIETHFGGNQKSIDDIRRFITD
jgi:hypothetical protein